MRWPLGAKAGPQLTALREMGPQFCHCKELNNLNELGGKFLPRASGKECQHPGFDLVKRSKGQGRATLYAHFGPTELWTLTLSSFQIGNTLLLPVVPGCTGARGCLHSTCGNLLVQRRKTNTPSFSTGSNATSTKPSLISPTMGEVSSEFSKYSSPECLQPLP